MVVPRLADLDKLNPPVKRVHDFLVTARLPPFHGYVVLAAGGDDPERGVLSSQLMNLRVPLLLPLRQLNIAFAGRQLDGKPEPFVEKFDETVQTVVRDLIAAVDQG